MKKSLFFVLFITICAGTTMAQDVFFGFKAGINATNLTGADSKNVQARMDVNAGIVLNIPVGRKISLQPELFYSGQGASLSTPGIKTTVNLGYVSLPLLFKYVSPGGFYVNAGPQASLLIYAHKKAGDDKSNLFPNVRKIDIGLASGVGLHTKINLDFDVRYNLGLAKVYTNDSRYYNSVYQVGLIYTFKSPIK